MFWRSVIRQIKPWATTILLLILVLLPLAAQAGDGSDRAKEPLWFFVSMFVLLVIIGAFMWYMYDLQRRFLGACKDDQQMAVFIQAPFGVPIGSVRSFIALTLITTSLYFLFLHVFLEIDIPDGLTTLLGTVIGFYFGSRSGGSKGNEALEGEIADLKEKHDTVVAEKDESQAAALIKKVEGGIAVSKIAANLLPESMRKQYDETVAKLEEGVAVVKNLLNTGEATQAAQKAGELHSEFKSDNPVVGLIAKASQSFGRVLGGGIPQVALILAIVGIGTKLIGVSYQKWRARILQSPFSPAVIPLEVVDANTGFVLLTQSPKFRSAFDKELKENDRPFMKQAVEDFLREGEIETLWQKYQARFDSRQEFEAGLDEFRRAAATAELKRTIDPQWTEKVGGYDALMMSVDKIQADPEARGDLQALVLVTEGLKKNNQQAQAAFEKAAEEVSK